MALPRPRLRPALHHLRGPGRSDDSRAAGAGRPGYGRSGALGDLRRRHQGHLVRAEVLESHGHHLFRRGSAPAGLHGVRRARFPYFLGQRLCRAPLLGRPNRAGYGARYRWRLPRGGQSRPLPEVRLHLEDHLSRRRRGGRGGQPRQRRRDQGAHESPGHRPRQAEPAAPRPLPRGGRATARAHGGPRRPYEAEVRLGGRETGKQALRGRYRHVDQSARRLLRELRGARRHGTAHRGTGTRGRRHHDRRRRHLALRQRPGRFQHPYRALAAAFGRA